MNHTNDGPTDHGVRMSLRTRGPLVAGMGALLWLLWRSGTKPSRLTYPCQQAAFTTASAAFGIPIVSALVVALRRLRSGGFGPSGLGFVAVAVAVAVMTSWLLFRGGSGDLALVLAAPDDYRAQVFHQTGCAADPVGDRFPGFDDLVTTMGASGLKLYRSATTSLTSGPAGLIAPGDTVIIKINYQWSERGGTNTDLLRGLIRWIVDHPEGFSGEIVVCENAQFNSTEGFDRSANNAQTIAQSPHDVVAHFQGQGHRISHFDWTAIRYTQVGEYSLGDLRDGYIIYPWDSRFLGRMSYPKFQTSYGTRISLKFGLWDSVSGTYDRSHLKIINVPVLKSHHSTYGATACVKHYMGVVTRELSTNSHFSIAYGILGAVMGETVPPDLHLLDAIWINANPNSGPATTYAGATRRDELVASLDPVAADIWAVKNILIPGFLANGYSPPWPEPSADPDDPASDFRLYLDASMRHLVSAGYSVTNDLTKIDLFDLPPPGEVSDPEREGAPFTLGKDNGGYRLAWSAPFSGGPVDSYHLYRIDLAALGAGALPVCEAELGNGTSAVLSDLTSGCGFLVVGRNAAGDGSFGQDSRGRERPSPFPTDTCP